MPKNIQKITGKRASLHGNRSVRSTSITSHHFKTPDPHLRFLGPEKTADFLSQGLYPPIKTNGWNSKKGGGFRSDEFPFFQGVIFQVPPNMTISAENVPFPMDDFSVIVSFAGLQLCSCFAFSLHEFSFHFTNKNLDKGSLEVLKQIEW